MITTNSKGKTRGRALPVPSGKLTKNLRLVRNTTRTVNPNVQHLPNDLGSNPNHNQTF